MVGKWKFFFGAIAREEGGSGVIKKLIVQGAYMYRVHMWKIE